jgi:acetyl esterase/lipase
MPSKEFLAFQAAGGILPAHDFSLPETLGRYRDELSGLNTLPGGVLPEGTTVSSEPTGGVPCSRIHFEGSQPGKLILQIHGGGFSGGTPCTQQGPTIELGRRIGVDILSVDYRLAPEHPYPAALEDTFAVYKALLGQGYDPESIIFLGESAGGTLCLATALYARDQGVPVPGAIAAISPCGDASKSVQHRKQWCPEDTTIEENDQVLSFYIGSSDPKMPYLSPCYADFSGMPPILFQYGNREMLSEDGIELVAKAVTANVDVEAHFHQDMSHVFYLMAGAFPEADEAVAEIVAFLTKHFGLEG